MALRTLSVNSPGREITLDYYKKGSTRNSHQIRRVKLINRLLEKVDKPGRGLDYGCGLGDLTYEISGQFDNMVGVDADPERVEWANKEFAPLKFYQCGNNSLDFEDRSFDTVLSSVVINWVSEPDKYLANIHRVLDHDGQLIILVGTANKVRAFAGNAMSKFGKKKNEKRDFSLPAMKKLLQQEKFEVLDVDCYYDPPREALSHPKNLIFELMSMPMRLLKLPGYAHYYGIRAVKID